MENKENKGIMSYFESNEKREKHGCQIGRGWYPTLRVEHGLQLLVRPHEKHGGQHEQHVTRRVQECKLID